MGPRAVVSLATVVVAALLLVRGASAGTSADGIRDSAVQDYREGTAGTQAGTALVHEVTQDATNGQPTEASYSAGESYRLDLARTILTLTRLGGEQKLKGLDLSLVKVRGAAYLVDGPDEGLTEKGVQINRSKIIMAGCLRLAPARGDPTTAERFVPLYCLDDGLPYVLPARLAAIGDRKLWKDSLAWTFSLPDTHSLENTERVLGAIWKAQGRVRSVPELLTSVTRSVEEAAADGANAALWDDDNVKNRPGHVTFIEEGGSGVSEFIPLLTRGVDVCHAVVIRKTRRDSGGAVSGEAQYMLVHVLGVGGKSYGGMGYTSRNTRVQEYAESAENTLAALYMTKDTEHSKLDWSLPSIEFISDDDFATFDFVTLRSTTRTSSSHFDETVRLLENYYGYNYVGKIELDSSFSTMVIPTGGWIYTTGMSRFQFPPLSGGNPQDLGGSDS